MAKHVRVPGVVIGSCVLLAVLLPGLGVRAQVPVAQFRTGVDATTLNVTVVTKDHKPVQGLTRDDFTVLEDGKPQRIVSFSEERLPVSSRPVAAWQAKYSQDVVTNGGDARRLVAILMSYKIGADPWAVNKAKQLAHDIVSRLGPADMATVVWSQRSDDAQGFTADTAKLHDAIDRMRPGLPWATSDCIRKNMVDVLAEFPEKRKVIVEISEPRDTPAPAGFNRAIGRPGDPPPAVCTYPMPFAAMAQRANVVMYEIDPNGLTADGRFGGLSLEATENPTGGRRIGNNNAPEQFIGGIFEENSSFYLIAYESTGTKSREAFRRLDVRVNRSDVEVRAPKNWYETGPAAKDIANDPKATPSPLVKAMASVLPDSRVPLRVVAMPFVQTAGKSPATVAIVLGVTLPGNRRGDARKETLEIEQRAYDMDGKLRATVKRTAAVALKPDGTDAHLEVLSQMDLKPDHYEIRSSISSAVLNETASVYADVIVPDFFKDAVSLSGIALTSDPAVMSTPKDALASLLPMLPTSQREFPSGARASAFVRVYQKKATGPVTVRTEIRDAADAVVAHEESVVPAERFLSDRSANVEWTLPLNQLRPGLYLVTVVAQAGKVSAERSLQIVVR